MTLKIACSKCHHSSTVTEDRIGREFACPKCGHAWLVPEHSVDLDEIQAQVPKPVTRSVAAMVLDSLVYPVKPSGIGMMLIGSFLTVLYNLLEYGDLLAVGLLILNFGFFGAYYFEIVASTMNGENEVPDWPNLTDYFDDILRPAGRMLAAVVMSLIFGFALGSIVMAVPESRLDESTRERVVAIIIYIAACLYFPMAVLAVQASGRFLAASPHIVLPAIFRSMPLYILVVAAFAILYGLCIIAQLMVGEVPYVGIILGSIIAFYGMMSEGRLVGLFYLAKKNKLGWT